MHELPSSIEAYLEEAGFSGSEILILRRLMDGEPLTIRQLGAKTGKSTGVLDQAMKKLLKKNIVRRTMVNDVPKYSLDSMQTVVEWMQEDMEQKREMLLRRHQNFESFVTSLESGTKRPDIEYFEGEAGIKQAYIKLLNGPGDILHYLPVSVREEDDPLRDFRVQYFRERQHRKMFSRVLAHDTPLGRRYQSRDMFEYRKTVLVPEAEYPFTFEKIITGDRIACIDHQAQTACIIRYPELADVERTLFEAIWKQVQLAAQAHDSSEQKPANSNDAQSEKIAFSTVTASQVREFFLSPKSLIAFGICALLALGTTFMLYRQNLDVNNDRMKDRVQSIAATAALQFSAGDVMQIQSSEDVNKPEYAKLVHHLNRIRRENDRVKYVYILRPTEEPTVWKFVADADALDPFAIRDLDGNGVIDDVDHLSPPGEIYRGPNVKNPDEYFKLNEASSYDAATDQWGTFITGSAPIRDENGKPVAIIGVDIEADQLDSITSSNFVSIVYFIGFFALFVLVRFMAFNPRMIKEFSDLLKARSTIFHVILGLLIALMFSIIMYLNLIETRIDFVRNRIQTIATTGAGEFSAENLNKFRILKDTSRPEYQEAVRKLQDIRLQNKDIKYVYIFRPTSSSTLFEFIADADAFGHDLMAENDMDGNGVIDSIDEIPYPGLPYDVSHIDLLRQKKYFSPISSEKPYTDKWGTVLSGYAPIFDESNSLAGILAVDMDALKIYVPTFNIFIPLLIYILILTGLVIYMRPEILKCAMKYINLIDSRRWLYGVIVVGMGFYWAVFGLHLYSQQQQKEAVGKRLMAIAATAASEFDPNDLKNLRFARDMKTPEYQRVFKKLNEIRSHNDGIQWAYIYRPFDIDQSLWQFVADADSNYFLSAADDYNGDQTLTPNEENVWPGKIYYGDWVFFKDALSGHKSYSEDFETDQWGTFITGAAPIYSGSTVVAILGLDMDISTVLLESAR